MKTFDMIVLGFALVCLVSLFGLKISFKPFKITAEDWRTGLGWILLAVGIAFIVMDAGAKKYKKGLEKGSQMVIDALNKKIEEIEKAKEDSVVKPESTVNL